MVYTGRVQGVGFRYRTSAIARRFAVAGYVRNQPEGSVELVVEGEARELDAFLREVRDALENNIRDEKFDAQTASGEFSGFEIRH